ncbi:MAG: hypothetical protein K6C08_13225 [Oscillospiraceae bacterium]|nr:hypothetical protein [Oscillospiraceae bacterium]
MMDLFLSKLPEEKRGDFLKDIRSCKTKKEIRELLEKYGVVISEDESRMLHEGMKKEVSAEDMKNVAGGYCSCNCQCDGPCCWDDAPCYDDCLLRCRAHGYDN